MDKDDRTNVTGDWGLDEQSGKDAKTETQTSRAEDDAPDSTGSDTGGSGQERIPLIFRRQGRGVRYQRGDSITIYLLEDTADALTETLREMEDRFQDNDVQRVDVYEAILRNGLSDTEGVAAELETFGYGMSD